MKIIRKRGDTSNILQIFIQDSSSTTGAGLTGLTNATASLVAYFHRDVDTSATAINLVTMTVGTFTSSGFKEIDATNMPGWYQFCPPDAAFSATSTPHSCALHLKGAANMAPLPIEVQLIAADVEDGVHFGLTALPNAAAAASGGLPTFGTGSGQITASSGQVTVATNNDKTGYTVSTVSDKTGYSLSSSQTFNLTGSITGSLSGSVGSVTGAVGSVTGAVGSVTGNVGGNVVGSVASVTAGVTVTTNNDKAGYALTAAYDAAKTAAQAGDVMKLSSGTGANQISLSSGQVVVATNNDKTGYTVSTVSDKTGYSLSASQTFNLTGNVTGNLSGSVGSVTSPVTAGTVSDKTGYGLTSAYDAAKTAAQVGSAMTLDFTQAVPASNTAQTVGDALNAARAQGFGKWVLSGTTLTLYAADGSTTVRTFTLNSSTSPTSRT